MEWEAGRRQPLNDVRALEGWEAVWIPGPSCSFTFCYHLGASMLLSGLSMCLSVLKTGKADTKEAFPFGTVPAQRHPVLQPRARQGRVGGKEIKL